MSNSVMNSVLPHTTNKRKMGLHKMVLVAHNNPQATGPTVTAREPKRVEGGILKGWSLEAANAYVATPKPLKTWDYSWTENETYWEDNVHGCRTPEEVEALLPTKWFGYQVDKEVDDTLVKVCRMCTALVDRFVSMTSIENSPDTAAKWREQQLLKYRLQAVTELLEASIGDAIPVLKLRDPAFVQQCWRQLQEEERYSVMAALNGSEDDAVGQQYLHESSAIYEGEEGGGEQQRGESIRAPKQASAARPHLHHQLHPNQAEWEFANLEGEGGEE